MIGCVPVSGVFVTNCYFYIDDATKSGFIIDPGAQGEALLEIIRREGWNIEKILLTHGHFDHIGGVKLLREALNIPVFAHENADLYLLDPVKNLSRAYGDITVTGAEKLREGDIIVSDANPDFKLRVIYTPGHTEDSVVFYSEADSAAFVGDTIFRGSVGNWKYPGGNLNNLLRSVQKILSLPDDTALLSGHSEETTVIAERRRYLR